MRERVHFLLCLLLAIAVLLVVGSGTALSHPEHGDGTPETPLEPNDDSVGYTPIVGGIGVVVLLTVKMLQFRESHSTRLVRGGFILGVLLIGVAGLGLLYQLLL
jgi:hypothetical protein